MSKDKEILDSIADKEYEHGFVTDVEQEFIPKGTVSVVTSWSFS